MSVKLTDTQLVMLSAAAQRDDLCLATPDKMKGAVLSKVSEKLLKLGLVREVRVKAGMPFLATRRNWAELHAQTDGDRVESHRGRRQTGRGDRAKGGAATAAHS
jgi:hypothetical protein